MGGTFAAVHAMVGGLELTENRRQVDVDERAALAVWRADERRQALQTWSDTGRLQVTGTPEQAHEQMLEQWATARAEWTDPHDRIDRLLLLAHTNADVAAVNQVINASTEFAMAMIELRIQRLREAERSDEEQTRAAREQTRMHHQGDSVVWRAAGDASGMRLTGSAIWSNSPGNAINLRPNNVNPTNVAATARNDSGNGSSWDLITYALCAV